MEIMELEVERRWKTGKGYARKLRGSGGMPAICYRKGKDPIPLSLERRRIEKILQIAKGQNLLVRLKIKSKGGDHVSETEETVILKEMQRDPFAGFIHADFLAISMDKPIVVEVNLHLVGEPTEVLREGGIVQQLKRALEVECMPQQIPEHIDMDISSLTFGETIHVGDIPIPEGIKVMTDPKEPIVVISTIKEEEEVVEEEEAVEGAEEEEGQEEQETAATTDEASK